MSRLSGFAIFVIILAGFWAFSADDNPENFTEISARITQVSSTCRLGNKTGGSDWASTANLCREARMLVKVHPGYQKYEVFETMTIEFTYSIDGRQYTGVREEVSARKLEYRRGGTLPIQIDNDNPEYIRRL